jgi:hypothetical protein
MAFQTGSQVRPELGRADVSGFARAGEYYGQALANLGEQIGNAVTKYAVNKQKKEDKKLRYESILPYTTSMFGAEEGEKMAQTFSNDPKLGAQILEFAGMQKDQAALQQALAVSTTPEGDIDYPSVLPAYLEFGGRDPEGVVGLIEEAKGPGELIVDPETGVVTQAGAFKGITRVPTKPVEPSVTQIKGERGTYDVVTTEGGTRVFPVTGMSGIGGLTKDIIASSGDQGIPSFNTEEEALAANLEPGTEVLISGRKAKIQ